MKYYKVKIYTDGKVVKEEVTKEETRGYLGGICYGCDKEGSYNFLVESESKIQTLYNKFIKTKIREYKRDIKRIQNTISNLEKLTTII